MMRVYVEIDEQEVLDEIDTDDLVKELVTRKDWQSALDKTLAGKLWSSSRDNCVSLRDVCEAMRNGKPFEPILRDLAYNQFGFVI
jgi:hypothetical protein